MFHIMKKHVTQFNIVTYLCVSNSFCTTMEDYGTEDSDIFVVLVNVIN